MTHKKIFLDANVVVKLLEGYEVPELFAIAEESEAYTSVVCFNIIAYLWEVGKINCSKDDFDKFFQNVSLLKITEFECFKALEISDYRDIEDGLQIACAEASEMQSFFTYDKKLFNKYKNLKRLEIILCE